MATAGDQPGLLHLLLDLEAFGVEPVRHGQFLGLRGRAVGKVPVALWDLLERCQPQLLRHLKNEPTRYRQRKAEMGV
jgi:hypothetical protein